MFWDLPGACLGSFFIISGWLSPYREKRSEVRRCVKDVKIQGEGTQGGAVVMKFRPEGVGDSRANALYGIQALGKTHNP